jgi:uncharacterized protein (DUF983 family)
MTCPNCGSPEPPLHEFRNIYTCTDCGESYCDSDADDDTVETPTLRELGIDI